MIASPDFPRRLFRCCVGSRLATLFVVFSLPVLVSPAAAQSASPKPAQPAADEPISIAVFEVSADRDRGYSSRDAVGATRVNIPLIEISQAIS